MDANVWIITLKMEFQAIASCAITNVRHAYHLQQIVYLVQGKASLKNIRLNSLKRN